MNYLNELWNYAEKFGVVEISGVVLSDGDFEIWSGSGSSDKHHYGEGGLIQHTYEVVSLCLLNSAFFPQYRIDDCKLFLAALFHDVGKLWDYEAKWADDRGAPLSFVKARHSRVVHHIARSALVWADAKVKFGFKDDGDEVLHAILSHHGAREWGSPVSPCSRLAWLLHLSDSMSARLNDCKD